MHAKPFATVLAAAALALLCGPCRAESATLIRTDMLRANPAISAPSIMEVHRRSSVTILETRRDWVRVEGAGNRSGWLRSANLERLSALPARTGRASPNVEALPRNAPRASEHALILTIGHFSRPELGELAGSLDDARSAAEIARLSGVPDANIHYRADAELDREGLRRAFAELDARMGNGDKALIYLSGYGVLRRDGGRCGEAILTHDLDAFPLDELLRHLHLLAAKADKVFLILDVARGDAPAGTQGFPSRFAAQASDRSCRASDASLDGRRYASNLLILSASRANENAFGTSAGGLLTQALLTCLSGRPYPDSASGLADGAALRTCAQALIDGRHLHQHPSLAGNPELALATQTAPLAARDPRQVLRGIHAQRDHRRQVSLTPLAAAPGNTRLKVTSSTPGYVYVLAARDKDFRLLYPNLANQQNHLEHNLEIDLPSLPSKGEEWLVLITDAARDPSRAGFVQQGAFAVRNADARGVGDLVQELLAGEGSRACLFSETRNLGLAQARACSSLFGASRFGMGTPNESR